MSGVLILGAGGHAKVIADILFCQGTVVQGFLDWDPNLISNSHHFKLRVNLLLNHSFDSHQRACQ